MSDLGKNVGLNEPTEQLGVNSNLQSSISRTPVQEQVDGKGDRTAISTPPGGINSPVGGGKGVQSAQLSNQTSHAGAQSQITQAGAQVSQAGAQVSQARAQVSQKKAQTRRGGRSRGTHVTVGRAPREPQPIVGGIDTMQDYLDQRQRQWHEAETQVLANLQMVLSTSHSTEKFHQCIAQYKDNHAFRPIVADRMFDWCLDKLMTGDPLEPPVAQTNLLGGEDDIPNVRKTSSNDDELSVTGFEPAQDVMITRMEMAEDVTILDDGPSINTSKPGISGKSDPAKFDTIAADDILEVQIQTGLTVNSPRETKVDQLTPSASVKTATLSNTGYLNAISNSFDVSRGDLYSSTLFDSSESGDSQQSKDSITFSDEEDEELPVIPFPKKLDAGRSPNSYGSPRNAARTSSIPMQTTAALNSISSIPLPTTLALNSTSAVPLQTTSALNSTSAIPMQTTSASHTSSATWRSSPMSSSLPYASPWSNVAIASTSSRTIPMPWRSPPSTTLPSSSSAMPPRFSPFRPDFKSSATPWRPQSSPASYSPASAAPWRPSTFPSDAPLRPATLPSYSPLRPAPFPLASRLGPVHTPTDSSLGSDSTLGSDSSFESPPFPLTSRLGPVHTPPYSTLGAPPFTFDAPLRHPTFSSAAPLRHPTFSSAVPLRHPTFSSAAPLRHPTFSSAAPLRHPRFPSTASTTSSILTTEHSSFKLSPAKFTHSEASQKTVGTASVSIPVITSAPTYVPRAQTHLAQTVTIQSTHQITLNSPLKSQENDTVNDIETKILAPTPNITVQLNGQPVQTRQHQPAVNLDDVQSLDNNNTNNWHKPKYEKCEGCKAYFKRKSLERHQAHCEHLQTSTVTSTQRHGKRFGSGAERNVHAVNQGSSKVTKFVDVKFEEGRIYFVSDDYGNGKRMECKGGVLMSLGQEDAQVFGEHNFVDGRRYSVSSPEGDTWHMVWKQGMLQLYRNTNDSTVATRKPGNPKRQLQDQFGLPQNAPHNPVPQTAERNPDSTGVAPKQHKVVDEVTRVKNEVLELFPDVESAYLADLCASNTGPMAVNNICAQLLDTNYPRTGVPATATITIPEPAHTAKECTVDYYTNGPRLENQNKHAYNAEVFNKLCRDFMWIPAIDIKFMLSISEYYAQAHKMLQQIWAHHSKVAKQATSSFKKAISKLECDCEFEDHKGKKIRRKVTTLKSPRYSSMSENILVPELQREVEFVERKIKESAVEEDYKVACTMNEQEYEAEGQSIECGCCYMEVPFESMVQCYEGHLFCENCLGQYAKEAVYGQGKADLKCMTDLCDSAFPKSQLQKALPAEIFNKYEDRVTEENINLADLGDLLQCPSCEFRAILDPNARVFNCQNPECRKESCRHCQVDWKEHFGKKCSEVEKKDETKLRLEYEEKMTLAKVRVCHKCKAQFTKEDGCNKMTCRCGAKQCYICRKPNIDYGHFCRHPRDPGKLCTSCQACSLWTNPDEDDNRAVSEIQKEAMEEKKKKGFTCDTVVGVPDEPPPKKIKTH